MKCYHSLGLMTVFIAAPLAAQRPPALPPVDSGLVIRAWLDSGQLRGRLLMPMHASDDSVRYCRFPGVPCDGRANGRAEWLQLEGVRHLDVQVGTRWEKGAWIGGIVGGLLFVSLAGAFCEFDCRRSTGEQFVAAGTSIALHAAVGAFVGSAFPRFERRF